VEELIAEIEKLIPYWENMPGLCFFVKDLHGRYVYVNTPFADFVGRSVSSILYKKPEDVWEGNRRQIAQTLDYDEMVIEEEEKAFESVLLIKDAESRERFMQVYKIPVKSSSDGRILGIMGVGYDVTGDREKLFTILQILFRRLSKSEKQYFFFRTEGLSRGQIAKSMSTTVETVDSYRHRIMKKLCINVQEMAFLEIVYKLFIDYSLQ